MRCVYCVYRLACLPSILAFRLPRWLENPPVLVNLPFMPAMDIGRLVNYVNLPFMLAMDIGRLVNFVNLPFMPAVDIGRLVNYVNLIFLFTAFQNIYGLKGSSASFQNVVSKGNLSSFMIEIL